MVGGIVGALFGIVAMFWPHLTLSFFIYLFSALIIVISVIALGQSLANRQSKERSHLVAISFIRRLRH